MFSMNLSFPRLNPGNLRCFTIRCRSLQFLGGNTINHDANRAVRKGRAIITVTLRSLHPARSARLLLLPRMRRTR